MSTSTKASEVSDDLSITGRFLPANTRTLTFPGILMSQRLSCDLLAHKMLNIAIYGLI